ncbi:hypothetical protein WJE11_001957 [Klebsiella aerogenes]
MAGLTKEQRAQRAAAQVDNFIPESQVQEPEVPQLVAMVTDFPAFPDAPTTADVHPDEVENWKAHGWKEME